MENLNCWLTSLLPEASSQIDGMWITKFHAKFSEENGFAMRDFYCEETSEYGEDIDKELTKNIQITNYDINNCGSDCQYTHNHVIAHYSGDVTLDTEDFIDIIYDDEKMCAEKQYELIKCVEIYGSDRVFIPPGIVLSHVSLLFKMVISLILEKNMIISLPEINYSPGKYTVSYNSSHILSPKHKAKFYKFCFDNTTKSTESINLDNLNKYVIAPPIITKELIGKQQLNLAITLNKKQKDKNKSDDNNVPYKLLSYEDTKQLLEHMNLQYANYYNWIVTIWDSVFKPYLTTKGMVDLWDESCGHYKIEPNDNCCVLDLLCKASGGPNDEVLYSDENVYKKQNKFNNHSSNKNNQTKKVYFQSFSDTSETEVTCDEDDENENSTDTRRRTLSKSLQRGVFRKFFEDQYLFQELLRIKNKLRITVNKHNAEYRKKKMEEAKNQKPQQNARIDTRKLVGFIDY